MKENVILFQTPPFDCLFFCYYFSGGVIKKYLIVCLVLAPVHTCDIILVFFHPSFLSGLNVIEKNSIMLGTYF
jgi:hypothetical protein